MCSDNHSHVYQYCGGASELPAGDLTVEGTTSFYEMPASFPSFPRVELEQPYEEYSEKPSSQYPWDQRTSYPATPEQNQGYHKLDENATLRRNVPLPATNLPRLPKLEVPQSHSSVPKLISDHSPSTRSPISPFTPVPDADISYSRDRNSQLYLDAVSPCAYSRQSQIFAHYGSWASEPQYSPATPSTATSYGSSLATTPISAHASSNCSSFQPWPQAQLEQMPPTYLQARTAVSYNPRMNDPSAVGTISWSCDSHLQSHNNTSTSNAQLVRHDYGIMPFSTMATSFETKPQAEVCYDDQRQFYELQTLPTDVQLSFEYEAPPVYKPATFDTHPPATNPRQHYPPSVCQHCEKVFTGKYGPGNCKRHTQQTHGTVLDRVRTVCRVCKKQYNRADAMRKHAWKKHRLEEFRPNKRRRDG